MNTDIWYQMWKANNIGFHKSEVNASLMKHFDKLSLPKNSRIFLPLCGKTLDIGWLLKKGYRIAGAELVETAVEQLFDELSTEPQISKAGKMIRYSAQNIDIFVGNIFDLSGKLLGPVDAIYDRAALVALPENLRQRYTAHLSDTTENAPQLLIVYEYDQTLMEGPPFSITEEELIQHYGDRYDLSLVGSTAMNGKLKGLTAAQKNVWLLRAK